MIMNHVTFYIKNKEEGNTGNLIQLLECNTIDLGDRFWLSLHG